jgi:hypothetical protein
VRAPAVQVRAAPVTPSGFECPPWWIRLGAAARAGAGGVADAVSAAVTAWRVPKGWAQALLIDLDNLHVPARRLPEVLAAVLVEAAPFRVAVAAGHPLASRAAADVCAAFGIQVLLAPSGRDSADRVLLREAGRLAAQGVRGFVVCSHDGAFTLVPGPYRLVVTGSSRASGDLVAAADEVVRLP